MNCVLCVGIGLLFTLGFQTKDFYFILNERWYLMYFSLNNFCMLSRGFQIQDETLFEMVGLTWIDSLRFANGEKEDNGEPKRHSNSMKIIIKIAFETKIKEYFHEIQSFCHCYKTPEKNIRLPIQCGWSSVETKSMTKNMTIQRMKNSHLFL